MYYIYVNVVNQLSTCTCVYHGFNNFVIMVLSAVYLIGSITLYLLYIKKFSASLCIYNVQCTYEYIDTYHVPEPIILLTLSSTNILYLYNCLKYMYLYVGKQSKHQLLTLFLMLLFKHF